MSLVAPQDVGKASGTYPLRQLGRAFGVAILGAVFAAAGGYGSARAFSDGYAPAVAVSALPALAAAGAGLAHPRHLQPITAAPAEAAVGYPRGDRTG